jgi:hypothetical protein
MTRLPDTPSAAARRRFHLSRSHLKAADADPRSAEAIKMIAGLLKGCSCWIEYTPAGTIRYAAYQHGRLQIIYALKLRNTGRSRPSTRALALDVEIGRRKVFEIRWDDDSRRRIVAADNWSWTKSLRAAWEKDAAASPCRPQLEPNSRCPD